jgi:hypothetical protein
MKFFSAAALLSAAGAAATTTGAIPAHLPAAARDLIAAATGEHAGLAHARLAQLADTHGARLSGSRALEGALDDIVEQLGAEGFANLATEPVDVPAWRPKRAELTMIEPYVKVGGYVLFWWNDGTSKLTEVKIFTKKKKKKNRMCRRWRSCRSAIRSRPCPRPRLSRGCGVRVR